MICFKYARWLTVPILGILAIGLGVMSPVQAETQSSSQDQPLVEKAKAFVADAAGRQTEWTGPTSGPKAQEDKLIVFVSSDQTNSGVRKVGESVKEAAQVIGWDYRVVNGQGSVSGRGKALSQAITMQPDGIVIGGFNAKEHANLIKKAHEQGINVVGWHAASNPGPIESPKVFFNVTTPAKATAKAAAYLAIAKSNGKANAIIFTDTAYAIAVAKSKAMADIIRRCDECEVLEVRNQSLATAIADMPKITTSFLQRYGDKWTYTLGINDLYFDGMAPALAAAGVPPEGPPYNISAGDGSKSAMQRIRQNRYQRATVAEPLRLHGWQLVDELNRAFAGAEPSGFSAQVHIITTDNVKYIDNAVYDPANNYRQHYRQIWGVAEQG